MSMFGAIPVVVGYMHHCPRGFMTPQGLVSEELIAKVSPDWWETEGGESFLKLQRLRQGWIEFLSRFDFDVWFTVTFKNPANYAGLAIKRTAHLLRLGCKRFKVPCDAFIVAEEHSSGLYHTHGMMRLDALDRRLDDQFQGTLVKAFRDLALDLYGINRFYKIQCESAVRYYVVKYITKRPADYLLIARPVRKVEVASESSKCN